MEGLGENSKLLAPLRVPFRLNPVKPDKTLASAMVRGRQRDHENPIWQDFVGQLSVDV